MDENFIARSVSEIKTLTVEIQKSFSSETDDKIIKWSLLKTYHNKYLLKKDFDKFAVSSYVTVLSVLLDALHPNLFPDQWHEALFDEIFLQGILHESFLILVNRLDTSEKYVLEKCINLLQKFVQSSTFEALFLYQCISHKNWDLKYVSKSTIWNDLITGIVSLPERIANKTQGKFIKIFTPSSYMPLLFSSVFKVLGVIHNRLKKSQDSSVTFISQLTGRMCLIGNADLVAKKYSKELIILAESNFIWRRLSENFISKMPSNSLDSFITNLFLNIPWYGYVEWILGQEGIKNEKINYIMTVKLLFFRTFKQVIILQNTIGYFASSPDRVSHFIKILNSLLDSWIDERSLKHQNTEQKIYISSALMICAGWLKHLKLEFNNKDYINKALKGTQIRLRSSEDTVRSLGLIVSANLIKSLDPDAPPFDFELTNVDLINHLENMLEIPLKPCDTLMSNGNLKCFEVESQGRGENISGENEAPEVSIINEDLDSDDDIETHDSSTITPEIGLKRPLYLRDCMMGLIEQENVEWTEQCMKSAEELIKANPYAAEEVAEEMAKIILHLTDSCISDFVAVRHKILITLTVQCPVLVASYLVSQFTEREYTIRQRLDILEVLAASSVLLSHSGTNLVSSETQPLSLNEDVRREADWQLIINQRLEAKTKRNIKVQEPVLKENKFSAIAGNFFYPLLNCYEKACKILKLDEDDSYVLGRYIYTLGIIMSCSSNTLHCSQMGSTFLQFLATVRLHKDIFVRQAIIFAIAATYTAVPSSLLFSDMLTDVTDTSEWLQYVAQNDINGNCVEKALYALSIFQNAAAEGSVWYQVKNLASP